MPYLMLLNEKALPVKEWKLTDASLTVGRAESMDLSVEDPRMSRRHFKIEQLDKKVTVTDLGSKSGLRIKGQTREHAVLKSGDLIEAGDTSFFYEAGIQTLESETASKANLTTIGKVIQDLRIQKPDAKPE